MSESCINCAEPLSLQLLRLPSTSQFPHSVFSEISSPYPSLPIPFPSFSSSLFNQSINQATDGQTNKRTNNLTAEYLRYDNIQFIRSTSGTTYTHTQRKKNKKKKKGGKIARPSHHAPCLIMKIKTPVPTCVREPQLNSAQKRKGDTIPSFLSFLPTYGQGELEERPGRVGFCTMDGSMDE